MANDSDACVPKTLTDFVFDLYDSVTLSQLTEEQSRLYNTVFRDLSSKVKFVKTLPFFFFVFSSLASFLILLFHTHTHTHTLSPSSPSFELFSSSLLLMMLMLVLQYFATSPWPSPQSIASECNGDPLFLAFYRELTHRHWHAASRPNLRDRMEGWDVYRELFDELLETAEDDATSTTNPKLFILPEWAFDILHEFVYQFQGFCQFRTTLYASANKHNLLGGPGEPNHKAPHHVVENVALMQDAKDQDIWSVDTVLHYLHRLVAIGTSPSCKAPAYQYFGIFASVALSRLECLLTDYTGCLQVMAPVLESSDILVEKADQESKSFTEVVHSVFGARLSLTYHAGISFLMLRRYKDCVTMVGSLCSYMQRGFKVCQERLCQVALFCCSLFLFVVSHSSPCCFCFVDGPTPQIAQLGPALQKL